jgi:hypothetical protein
VNDAERLSQDPTFRLIGSEKIWERGAALTCRLQSFERELLTQDQNLAGLAAINRELIPKAEAVDSPQRVVLDMDSTEIPVCGEQENSAYSGYFESTRYHPVLLFNRQGACSLLLATAGGGPPDAGVVQIDGTTDHRAALARRMTVAAGKQTTRRE